MFRTQPLRAILTTAPLFLILVGFVAHPYGKRDGPDRVLVLDGSPVHNVGELKLHMSNWGMFGSSPGSSYPFSFAPSGEWPAGSGIEHVFASGLWVGALKNGVPAVSTAAYQFEFRPTQSPVDILYRSARGAVGGIRLPWPGADDDNDGTADEEFLDGRDNDLDGQVDEDYAAISDQMFARWYTDDQPEAGQAYPGHNPLHITVREQSYQWDNDEFDDFVGEDFEITNTGSDVLEQVYVGVFHDGDVGNRNTPNYFTDDVAGFVQVPVVNTPYGPVQLEYGYIGDSAGGSALAVLLLDHPVDPTGSAAPSTFHWSTFNRFDGVASYEDGGDPTNDFERYELMSSSTIERDGTAPADYRIMLCAGPFDHLAPGETIKFSVALVGIPAPNDLFNLSRAAIAYRGRPASEYQVHWVLPGDELPVPVAIQRFDARCAGSAVRLAWETWADEEITGYELVRSSGHGSLLPLAAAIPADQREYLDTNVASGTHYEYQLVARGVSGWTAVSQRVGVTVPALSLALDPGAPNPFRGSTTIRFTVPERSHVELSLYDAAGRRVTTIVSGERAAGAHEAAWGGTDDAGRRVSAGVYFCRLEAGKQTMTRKVSLLK